MTPPDVPERERAKTLLEIAADDPDAVSAAELVNILIHGTRPSRSVAAEAYAEVVDARPTIAASVASELHTLLGNTDEGVRAKAAGTIAHVAERDPSPFRQSVPLLLAMIEPPIDMGRNPAIRALLVLSRQFPQDIEPDVSSLLDILENELGAVSGQEDGGNPIDPSFRLEETDVVRFAAARILLHVTSERPAKTVDMVPRIAVLLDDPDAHVRGVACEILGAVAREYPVHVHPHLEKLATLFVDDSEPPVPWKAASALAVLVEDYPEDFADAVADDAGELTLLLNDPGPDVRGVGVALLTYVVEYHPDAVEPTIDRLCELLTDENPLIRANAARTLQAAGAVAALDMLDEVARTDPNPDVQEIAQEARRQIQHHEVDGFQCEEDSKGSTLEENV